MERKPTRSFEELVVWQKAHQFVLGVYRITKMFPDDEKFGLTAQFRRAAVSIAANIAEGYRKRTPNDKVRFMNIAEGSLEECRYYLILARDLGYADIAALWELSDQVRKLILAYGKAILKTDGQ
ncbi:MAG: four helix bundle protein [Deltaproteobacteria bacterium RIFOXYD12_FULL_50_9]|nr:MAG: four helix bundle protein [Deltaproteobacteria bacterium RIFOXYD12_FULL_50_9]